MIRLDRPVIVEGKYDKITLENVIDALIIPTDGFRIFKSPEKAALIRAAAKDKGVIVMTDSDPRISQKAFGKYGNHKCLCSGT